MSMTSVIVSSLASSVLVAAALLLVAWTLWLRKRPAPAVDLNDRILSLAARAMSAGLRFDAALQTEIEALLATAGPRGLAPEQRQVLEWLRDRANAVDGSESTSEPPRDAAAPKDPANQPRRHSLGIAGVALVRPTHVDDDDDLAAQIAAMADDAGEDADTQVHVGALSTALCFDADPDRRANAAIGLGRLGHPSGVPHLVTALRSDSTERVRTFSAVALGMIGSREAISPLIDVIQKQIGDRLDVSSEITYGGFQLIRTLQREIDPDPSDWLGQDPVAAQIWALGRIGSPQASTALCERLNDDDPGIRWFAAWALGKIGDDSNVSALVGLLDDRSIEVRWIAIWSLGRMNSASAVPNLIEKASDRDASIRRIAIWALGRSGDVLAREAVLKALTDPERGVRQIASWALSRLDPDIKKIA